MADVETPAAESSPAEQPLAEERQPPEVLAIPTDPEEYAEWRQTGKLPASKTKAVKEDSATSKQTPSSEDSAPSPKKQKNADTRKEELNREIQELLAKRDQAKREVEAVTKKDVKAESSPAEKPPEPRQRPVKPKHEDFKTWEEMEAANDKYAEELSDYIAEKKIEQYIQQQRQEAATRQMQERLDAAKSRYGDEAEPKIIDTATAVFEDQGVAPALKVAMNRSPVLVDALYVLGSDAGKLADFKKLAKTDPIEAMREWFVIEGLVKQELSKQQEKQPAPEARSTPPQGPDGKFLPSAKTRTTPAPPVELGGNSSPPGDERDRAAAAGNVRAFFEAGNRKDFARWKGQT